MEKPPKDTEDNGLSKAFLALAKRAAYQALEDFYKTLDEHDVTLRESGHEDDKKGELIKTKVKFDMNKTLHLPLKKEWYDMIESGAKTEEYREIKPYWSKRLLKDFPVYWRISLNISMIANDFSAFDGKELHPVYTHIKFSYGYTKRNMTFEIKSITIGKGKPEWGAPTEKVFIIKLGKRIWN